MSVTRIILEDFNFEWSIVGLKRFLDYWYEGRSLREMSELFCRPEEEVLLLMIDYSKRGKIKGRPNGVGANDVLMLVRKNNDLVIKGNVVMTKRASHWPDIFIIVVFIGIFIVAGLVGN
ncbi:hypothetical protein [Bacillus sp. 179-C3.3 HS]|uniref:hypothetical protein n=1 Tax=Bacillus sp. 179-C3.3 HS TaxID=3232162 RepID=UPI0039A38632